MVRRVLDYENPGLGEKEQFIISNFKNTIALRLTKYEVHNQTIIPKINHFPIFCDKNIGHYYLSLSIARKDLCSVTFNKN
jgi:hypothetical protein